VASILKHLPDDKLLQLYCSQKRTDAFGIIYEKYIAQVYGVCMKYLKEPHLASDQSMQLFEQLLKNICKQTIKQLPAWLHTVTKNHCLMYLRSQKSITTYTDHDLSNTSMESDEVLHHIIKKEQSLEQLEAALQQLSQEQRTCITLFYLQNKSYTTIAQLTGFSMLQVKSFIQNGKRNLKIKMMEANQINE
jgi:RNA polymerase sigma factor, sigma-70 family